MTRKFCLKNFRTRFVAILAILCLICTLCFGLVACNDSEKISVTDPSYSKTEQDAKITNPNFYVGTANVKLDNLPIASTSGWGKVAVDNSASTSSVPSGAVVTSEAGWNAVLTNLVNDSDFVNYLYNKFNFTSQDVIDAIKAEKGDSYSPNTADKKNYIVETYVKPNFPNPSTHDGATDNAIYMMNNIATKSNYRLGTAQKITSTTSFNLEKNTTYKISVWVKTFDVSNFSETGDYGANIRLKNTLNSKTQANYCVSNIVAEDWTQYSIYVKADKDYNSTITLILGLGYGNGDVNDTRYYVEGTAFFDDITIEKVETTPAIEATNLVYGGSQNLEANLNANNECIYDMSITSSIDAFFEDNSITLPLDAEFTKSNATTGAGQITSQTFNPSSSYDVSVEDGATKVSVNQASVTLPIVNENFVLDNGEYLILSFYYKNLLNKLGSTNFSIDVIDMYNTITKVRPTVFSLSTTEDWTKCVLVFKNNFVDDAVRTFKINFVIGPSNVRTVEYASDFATGDVYIKDVVFAKGVIDDENAENTDIYNLLSSSAKATIALYAGYATDYQNQDANTNYAIKTAHGNFGDIISNPTAPQNYLGVVSDHVFIKNQTEDNKLATVTNTATGKGDTIRVAGVINTQYLANYTYKTNSQDVPYGDELIETLAYDEDEPAQMLMIKNNVKSSYGYLTTAYTIAESSYAKVSVKLKVANNATAYVYLINVKNESKDIMTFNDFTVNTDIVNGVSQGTQVNGKDLTYAIKVTEDMMVDGWAEVNFFIGSGASSKNFRVEVWNGDRSGDEDKLSQGYVFIKSIDVLTSSAFSEPTSWANAFTIEGNPLYTAKQSSFKNDGCQLYAYERELTATESKFNAEYPDDAVSYNANYVWAKNSTMVYGIYNTVDPTIVDPYDSLEEDEKTGCAKEVDASTFWLSFSSVILAVVLILALGAVITKKIYFKHKANASDAKSHYTVTSRIRKPATKTKKENLVDVEESKNEQIDEQPTDNEQTADDVEEAETTEEVIEQTEEVEEANDYVYGEVESFGDEDKKDE